MNRSLILITLLAVSITPACDKKKKAPPAPIEVIEEDQGEAVKKEEEPKKVYVPDVPSIPPPDYDEQRAYEKSLDDVKYDSKLHGGEGVPGYENKFDWDPTITPDVQRVDITGKLWRTEDGPGANVLWDAPKILNHITWTDRAGTNLLVYGMKAYDGGGGLLTAEVAVREGDAWVVQRQFKEIVETCKFDLVLDAAVDPEWSIKDIDGDGYAEVTMVWTADCTSDVSPNKHKVIIASQGKKYALRGVTKVNPGGGPVGGEYKADPAFDKAPKGFLDHAKMVWDKTNASAK